MPPRAGKILSAVTDWDWTTWVSAAFLAIVLIYNLLGLGAPDIREGEECGPHHHWVHIRSNVTDADLTCEQD